MPGAGRLAGGWYGRERAQPGSQPGRRPDLEPAAGTGERATVTVPGDSLAAALAVAEKCAARHRSRAQQNAKVLAAPAEVRAALPRRGGALRNSK